MRVLLFVVVALVSALGAACTKPAWNSGVQVTPDAGEQLTPESGVQVTPDSGVVTAHRDDGSVTESGVHTDAAAPPAGPVSNDGGAPPPLEDAATPSACVVGVSKLGECKLR